MNDFNKYLTLTKVTNLSQFSLQCLADDWLHTSHNFKSSPQLSFVILIQVHSSWFTFSFLCCGCICVPFFKSFYTDVPVILMRCCFASVLQEHLERKTKTLLLQNSPLLRMGNAYHSIVKIIQIWFQSVISLIFTSLKCIFMSQNLYVE